MATSTNLELGIVTTLPSTVAAVGLGKQADALGFDRVGLGDTAPRLYHSCYPALTALLLQTERIKVGPYVTNPVTRHWSIHGATARALEELAPGRFFLGIGTGDGAVHSVGLKPATLAEFRDSISELRNILPKQTQIQVAFSGVKGMAVAGDLADEVTIGIGLDAPGLRDLAGRARAARQKAGVTAPLKIWVPAPVHFAASKADIPALRAAAGGMVALASRFAFSVSFEGKNVPEDYQPFIRKALGSYTFAHHAKGSDNPNARLFDERPDIRDYLIDRFAVIGTPEQCAERIATVAREAELDGLWLMPVETSAGDAEIKRRLGLAAQHFLPLRHR
jgi:alkanesulfonate monooxygenase SsuD/methylene tetrahydromethanopterin reductase-like flavin-dependent oxidoreductase (luciferase family)